jgi:ABC-type multidrug transport system fused ATPase/permease subunit
VATLADVGRDLAVVAAGAERMSSLLRAPIRVDETGAVTAVGGPVRGIPVEFLDVTFRYGRELSPALEGVSFRIEAGETIALVGHSGAGKSTTIQLLLRFWDPESGSIRIGDVDLRDLRDEARTRVISLVPQDVYLFHESVRDNLRLGDPDAPAEEILVAARAALADEFILGELPDGFDTIVGERGARLSGGQRQRIGIARALLMDAPVLVLDEPVSHLDAESERFVAEAIKHARKGRTTILIAHRLSTIQLAQRVLVLDHGRLVEDGTPTDLIRRDGPYARLVRAQRDGSLDGVELHRTDGR